MKNSKRRTLVTLVAALAAVAAMALPAAAHVSPTVVVFSGTFHTPALGLPVVSDGNSGAWYFASGPNETITVPGHCISVGAHTGVGCSIGASGTLGPVAGTLGAWCGLSTGTGTGSSTASDGATIDITSITWAGSILLFTGTWADPHGSGTSGVIVGAGQTFGGSDCAAGAATNFDVVGVLALV